MRRGDTAGAIREWEAALAAEPKNETLKAEVAKARAGLAEDKGRLRRRAQARYEDGLAAYQRGEVEAALDAWKETLELDPEHVKARANIRKVEQEMK
jgi:tetratricopeptide (TPR) repeat protein